MNITIDDTSNYYIPDINGSGTVYHHVKLHRQGEMKAVLVKISNGENEEYILNRITGFAFSKVYLPVKLFDSKFDAIDAAKQWMES